MSRPKKYRTRYNFAEITREIKAGLPIKAIAANCNCDKTLVIKLKNQIELDLKSKFQD